LEFEVGGLGSRFRVWVLRFRVWGLYLGHGLGFRILGLGFIFTVQGSQGSRVVDFGFMDFGLLTMSLGYGFQDLGCF
jgi:hypothetical protein